MNSINGIRLSPSGGHVTINPKTKEEIRIQASPNDVEVYVPEGDEWVKAISWWKGRASINARFEITASDPFWAAISQLAIRLDATIAGDEGEIYDPVTGESKA